MHTWLQLQFEFTLIFDGSLEFLIVFSDSLSVSESLMSAKLVFLIYAFYAYCLGVSHTVCMVYITLFLINLE